MHPLPQLLRSCRALACHWPRWFKPTVPSSVRHIQHNICFTPPQRSNPRLAVLFLLDYLLGKNSATRTHKTQRREGKNQLSTTGYCATIPSRSVSVECFELPRDLVNRSAKFLSDSTYVIFSFLPLSSCMKKNLGSMCLVRSLLM